MQDTNTNTPADAGSEDKIRSAWGRAVASAAIKEMTPKEEPAAFSNDEIAAFTAECKTNGKDVVDVVEHIAKREGIDLAGDEPKDTDKSRIWKFLRQVIAQWVNDFSCLAAQDASDGEFNWKAILQDYINDRFGEIFKCKDECCGGACNVPTPPTNDLVLKIPRFRRRTYPFVGVPGIP